MGTKLEEEKQKVEIQKKKIQLKERILKEKEKRRRFKRFSEIIEIAFKADIHEMEEAALLGAFLDISEKMKDERIVQKWKENGSLHLTEQHEKPQTPLAISFETDPGKDVRDRLKVLRFRWNAFRKEYCGYGDRQEIEGLLKGTDHNIQVIKS